MKRVIALLVCAACLTGCAAVFSPKKQKITIATGNEKSTVYVDKEEFGTGATIHSRIGKTGARQVLVRTENFKDNYTVLKPHHRSAGFWIAQIFNMPFNAVLLFIPTGVDCFADNAIRYKDYTALTAGPALAKKAADDKYLAISRIRMNVADKKNDLFEFEVPKTKKLQPAALRAKMEQLENEKDLPGREKEKKKGRKILQEDDNKMIYDDTRFTGAIYKSLKLSGYVDTVNKVFSDNNNTLLLEGAIRKVYIFRMATKGETRDYYITKLHLTWYLKNTYSEILDSVNTSEYSGEFIVKDNKDETIEKMLRDALESSYLNLHKEEKMKKHLRQNTQLDIQDPLLTLVKPASVITEKSTAFEASVIVKTDRGHGSGFAITNDGYVITNYHVVAGRQSGVPAAVKVITSNGEELQGTVVRFNKFRDLALVKVEKSFEKAFACSNTKSYKTMQSVFTIGAPKSVELGQSISTGVISNERKNNNNHLLQLGMPVNAGNSGGPLFDDSGALHGVIVAKLVGEHVEGVSFAVPGYLIGDYLKIGFK